MKAEDIAAGGRYLDRDGMAYECVGQFDAGGETPRFAMRELSAARKTVLLSPENVVETVESAFAKLASVDSKKYEEGVSALSKAFAKAGVSRLFIEKPGIRPGNDPEPYAPERIKVTIDGAQAEKLLAALGAFPA